MGAVRAVPRATAGRPTRGWGLTIGPHPMAMRRDELALRGVLRACDLPIAQDGRRVRVAGMGDRAAAARHRQGFVFLTLEDETGISNVIIRPDLFDRAAAGGRAAAVPAWWTACCSTRTACCRCVPSAWRVSAARAVDARDFY